MEQEESNTSLNRKSKRLDVPRLDASLMTSTPSATTVHPSHSETKIVTVRLSVRIVSFVR